MTGDANEVEDTELLPVPLLPPLTDAVASPTALHRDPVAAYIGAAMMMPSGMLCSAMAMSITGPNLGVKDEKATAKPSGML